MRERAHTEGAGFVCARVCCACARVLACACAHPHARYTQVMRDGEDTREKKKMQKYEDEELVERDKYGRVLTRVPPKKGQVHCIKLRLLH